MAFGGQLSGTWYSETSEFWPGQAMSLQVRRWLQRRSPCAELVHRPLHRQVKEVLHQSKSDFQDVLARARVWQPLPRCVWWAAHTLAE